MIRKIHVEKNRTRLGCGIAASHRASGHDDMIFHTGLDWTGLTEREDEVAERVDRREVERDEDRFREVRVTLRVRHEYLCVLFVLCCSRSCLARGGERARP